MTEIIKNFLPRQHFEDVKRLFLTEMLPWHFNDRVVSTEHQFMFTHAFMNDGRVINPHFFEPVRGMLLPIQQRRHYTGVSRIKANLYTNQGKPVVHPVHHDIPPDSGVADQFFIAVYHVNTCNGMTVVEGKEIPSEENQLILFDNVAHYGTVQTDTDIRVVINFNLHI
ncbi:MAG: hypothetical protein KDI19_12275 [Pseudomonadales bacterium]|nr:hypothetical protein [Pseudomonadales bacterium]